MGPPENLTIADRPDTSPTGSTRWETGDISDERENLSMDYSDIEEELFSTMDVTTEELQAPTPPNGPRPSTTPTPTPTPSKILPPLRVLTLVPAEPKVPHAGIVLPIRGSPDILEQSLRPPQRKGGSSSTRLGRRS